MRALVLKQPGDAVVETVKDISLSEGEVLLRVRRVGLCGSDLNSYRGKNPLVKFPRILGHEIAATVVYDTPGRPDLPAGTEVTLSPYTSCGRCASCRRARPNACQFNQTMGVQRDGALCDYIAERPEKLYPANLSREALCLVEPLTVGFHAVARGRVTKNDTVAIIGCGGVGLGSVFASGFIGARTIAIDVDDRKLDLARRAGATDLIHSGRESMHNRLVELTSGHGPDVVIEAIGLPETFRAAVEEVAYTGRVVYIGYAKEPVAYESRLFVQKELDILGSRNALPEDFRSVIRMLEEGRFPVQDAVTTVPNLEDAPELLAAWSSDPSRFSKIMVTLD
jgi:threonine dehydrogenase-like Zn-dependent dehydrogenase